MRFERITGGKRPSDAVTRIHCGNTVRIATSKEKKAVKLSQKDSTHSDSVSEQSE